MVEGPQPAATVRNWRESGYNRAGSLEMARPMICPQCHTPNPEGAYTCAQCDGTLVDATPVPSRSGAQESKEELEVMATMGTPASLGELIRGHGVSASLSLVLPEGLEIGHRYRVQRLLGIGGMGAVYRVRDKELERDVALKLIRSEIADNATTLERFKREIHLSSSVTHRNVLRVFDLGESDGVKFLTMQYVEGEDLGAIFKREKKLPLPRVISIFRQICEGVAAAHEPGVIHRDLKPQNIMIDSSDRVYVTDFGLAKTAEQSGITQTGSVIGTPFYMSPEQVKGAPIDQRSDIYSLGVILYQMATGQLPYTGSTPYEVMIQRVQRPPRPARELNPEIPLYLTRILDRCMAIDPAVRYATVGEILQDLNDATFRPTMRYRMQRRRGLLPAAAAALAVLVALSAWWILRSRRAPVPAAGHKAESVLIADFENKTGDPVFDGTLEPAFGLALEGASFVTSYSRPAAKKIAAQLQPTATGLSEPLARLVAVREGIQVVTAGSIEKRGDGYRVSVRAEDAATGKPITDARADASGKDGVLSAAAKAAAAIRNALGDRTPSSVQVAAAETFTAGSLDAAHEYAIAQDLQNAGNWEEAIRRYQKAVELDPNLGRAYAGIAGLYANQGRREEAQKAFQLAMARIDRMSEREKFRTRGLYYLVMREPQKAQEQFEQLLRQYPADNAGMANLALAYFYRRDMARALAEGRRALEIYPKSIPLKNNVALYAMYAGDFDAAIRESQAVLQLNPTFAKAYVCLALSQAAQGSIADAAKTYARLETTGGWGASLAAIGSADLALAQGRAADAISILEKGVERDLIEKKADAAARKLLALAEAHLARGQTAAAQAAAERAVAQSQGENILLPAGRVFLEAGKESRALSLASELSKRFEPDARAYAKLLEGEAKTKRGQGREAISDFEAARQISDTWLGRFLLGRSYLEAKAFPEADAELEACAKRRGEAVALFLDEIPSFRYLPPVYYYLGRAQESLKSPAFTDSYKAFLAIKSEGGEDPLVADARRRLAAR